MEKQGVGIKFAKTERAYSSVGVKGLQHVRKQMGTGYNSITVRRPILTHSERKTSGGFSLPNFNSIFSVEPVNVSTLMQREPPTRLYLTSGKGTFRKRADKSKEVSQEKGALESESKTLLSQRQQVVNEYSSGSIKLSNLNEYIHLARPQGEDVDNVRNLQWILNLRSIQPEELIRLKRNLTKNDTTKADPPQVYFKTLNRGATPKIKETQMMKGNYNELIHMINNRRAGPKPSKPEIQFHSHLRQYARPQTSVGHAKRFETGSTNQQRGWLISLNLCHHSEKNLKRFCQRSHQQREQFMRNSTVIKK